jgi:hypothetical protein
LAGIVTQAFVQQGVDPPFGYVCFSREVFVAHLYRYSFMMPLLLEIQYETVEMIPETANRLTWSEERYPLLEVALLGDNEAGGVLYRARELEGYVPGGSPADVIGTL